MTLRAAPINADRVLSIGLVRVRGEFQENPDLQGSVEDIGRLIDADGVPTQTVLETLVRAGFLVRSAEGIYAIRRIPPG